jgi:hypothetical protein
MPVSNDRLRLAWTSECHRYLLTLSFTANRMNVGSGTTQRYVHDSRFTTNSNTCAFGQGIVQKSSWRTSGLFEIREARGSRSGSRKWHFTINSLEAAGQPRRGHTFQFLGIQREGGIRPISVYLWNLGTFFCMQSQCIFSQIWHLFCNPISPTSIVTEREVIGLLVRQHWGVKK